MDGLKRDLRAVLRARRAMARRQNGLAASLAVARHALACFPADVRGLCVGGYWPMGAELDPLPLMRLLAQRGASLALPVVTAADAPLIFRAWSVGDDLVPGPYGTLHPRAGADDCRPDSLLVPLVGFDPAGYRLGQGGGFYDRTLAAEAAARATGAGRRVFGLGLGFDCQKVDRIPRGPHDRPLDAVATDMDLYRPDRCLES